MDVKSITEAISVEDGVVQIAFDLSGSDVGYLIITMPEAGHETNDDFFGHDHYVELKDQLFGRYGGLSGLDLHADDKLEIRLNYGVPEVGNSILIFTSTSIDAPMRTCLQQLKEVI